MANRDLQAELELYKEAFFTKDISKLIQFYRLLFPDRISCANSSDTLYVFACRFDNCHAISLLYNLGDQTYDITSFGISPLFLAILCKNKECIRALLEIPEYHQIDKDIFIDFCRFCYDDAIIEMIAETALRIHTNDYFESYKGYNPKLSRVLHAVYGNQQYYIDEDDILGIRYRVFFNRSLTSRLLRSLTSRLLRSPTLRFLLKS
jgi:hypothetical protein